MTGRKAAGNRSPRGAAKKKPGGEGGGGRGGRPRAGAPFVHPTATVDEGAAIGRGTRVWHYAHVMGGARVGEECVIGQNVFVARTAVVGDRCKIQNNVSIYDGVVLEDEVFCGPSMVFTNVINPRAFIERKSEYQKTLVRRGATLGANSTILSGHTVGEHAFVGAGAVLTRDVPPHALALGVPARLVGWVCRCGVTLEGLGPEARRGPLASRCSSCGATYVLEGRTLRCRSER
jgi:UDP-2-acetamido-3-amino-2,3-dideoxy-glucuronate N-acetyltransferase